ncbi:hypothetical protein [Streptomyces luteireticuli]|uniref:Uncharacterized protein n=1 Tax=Streptomyces luteireticuli TaxID=173858 RepID=A0ABN0YY58_9ACTN
MTIAKKTTGGKPFLHLHIGGLTITLDRRPTKAITVLSTAVTGMVVWLTAGGAGIPIG